MDVFESSQSEEKGQGQKPRRKKITRLVLVFLIGLIGGGYFWIHQDPARQELLEDLYAGIQGSSTQAPTKPLVDIPQTLDIRPIPGTPKVLIAPKIPGQALAETEGLQESINSPLENPEGLDGTAIQIPLEIPADVVLAKEADASSFVGRNEDPIVQQSFVMALARWMADMYEPAINGNGAGRVRGSLQTANLRFGHSMNGLAYVGEDPAVGRKVALQHFYTPDMLKALYQLYNERFFVALKEAASVKNLSTKQKKEMYTLYERRFRGLAGAFESMATEAALSDRLALWHGAQSMTVESNRIYATAVFELDEAKEQKNTAKIQIAEQETQETGALYQAAIMDEAVALKDILALMHKNTAARLLDDGTLLYVALWVERRYEQTLDLEQAEIITGAVLQSSVVFNDIAQQFENASQ